METNPIQIGVQPNPLQPRIDVCIATYKRPELLRKLLRSLVGQETMGEFSYDIIVVDNDAGHSAEPVVNQFSNESCKVIYDVETQPNISLARNRSLRLATGDLIAIIDDDDYAENGWLLNLYRTLISYEADVVHGPVISIFPEGTPGYVKQNTLFRHSKLGTGALENHPTYTSNSLFRRKLIERMAFPFDPDFGRTGGEDILFFRNLKMKGYKFVWCSDAAIFESILPERANLFWILKRFFRNGNITSRMRDRAEENLMVILRSLKRLAIFLSLLPFYSFVTIFHRSSIPQAVRILEQIAFQIGYLAGILNLRYQEYRRKDQVS